MRNPVVFLPVLFTPSRFGLPVPRSPSFRAFEKLECKFVIDFFFFFSNRNFIPVHKKEGIYKSRMEERARGASNQIRKIHFTRLKLGTHNPSGTDSRLYSVFQALHPILQPRRALSLSLLGGASEMLFAAHTTAATPYGRRLRHVELYIRLWNPSFHRLFLSFFLFLSGPARFWQ